MAQSKRKAAREPIDWAAWWNQPFVLLDANGEPDPKLDAKYAKKAARK